MTVCSQLTPRLLLKSFRQVSVHHAYCSCLNSELSLHWLMTDYNQINLIGFLGKDVAIQQGAVREMLQRLTCDEFQMKVDPDYLIMGQDDAVFVGNAQTR